jgi:VWFA-related protein
MRSAAVTLVALGLSASAPGALSAQSTDGRTQSAYVGVVDGKGNAVTGLTVKDFIVREDGVAREVLRVEPSSEMLDIVLLVDDSQASTPAIPHIRDALTRFVARMQGKGRIGIVTIGERPMSVVERTDDPAALKKGIGRIFARRGTGAYLLEGIEEVVRGFRLREARRPTIIALTIEGVEFSNLQYERVIERLLISGAALHVLAIGTPAPITTDEQRNRNMVLAQGTEYTGGRRDQLLSPMALEERLDQLGVELINQYLVTYVRPEALVLPEKIQVTVNKPGLTVRARTRVSQKK